MEAEAKSSTAAENEQDDQWIAQSPPKLPNDVLFNILSRLPIQSLIQYICVCKSWRTMISNPQFIKTHLHRSSNSKSSDSQRLLLSSHDSFRSITCQFPDHAPKTLQSPLKKTKPLCSCDGLILLSVSHKPFPFTRNPGKSFVLWNPSIRAYKEIWPPFEFNDFGIRGICYDPNIDDYRVIILWQYFQTLVLIYDSKSNSWNTISEPCYSILVRQSGVLVNGVLYWVMASKELCSWVIVYFDLVEDKLKEVPRLSFGDEDDKKIDLVGFGDGDKMIDLVVLRECLCVYRCVDREKVEIWEMKEYGKKESWTKLIVIPYLIDLQCLKPLFFTNNGEVLIEVDNRKILVYDPKDSTFRNVRSYGDFSGFRVVTYVESLVFLNGDGDGDGDVQRQHQAYLERRNMKGR
ncbi:F-box protein CPR1 [Camellia lanceoleosa]|uniref:F-box protein CPR1 n=1 Tax=Camellia lanceoleosa TaxID=1840588 RepID=A0ACC0GQH7_9ERIC|nr:F-box protein CPR1 [Camellia lanceoleosa]